MPPPPPGPADLDDLYDLIVTRAARLAGTEDALLWLADDDGPRLVVRWGIGRFATAVGRSLGKGEGLAGDVWQAGTPQAVTGRQPSPDPDGGHEGPGAGLCVPLAAGGSMAGVLGVAWSEPGRVVGHAESELLGGWGELAGVLLDRAGRPDTAGPEPGGRPRGQGWLPGAEERYRALSEQVPAVLYSEVHTPRGAVIYKSPQNQVVAEPVVAWVDSAKVERVVENMLANAGRHTSPDTPVWVKVARRDQGVLLAVEDAGGGVPRELRATLFEPFRQGPGTSAHAPGVGIGLSLVARFAELHGGRAWVEDRSGGGASFQVLLPDPDGPADAGGRS